MTFSLAARCAQTGRLGVIVTSSSPAVGARCAFVRPGVGAACSQNITDPRLGDILLHHLSEGATADAALRNTVEAEKFASYRQLTVIDTQGTTAAHSGEKSLGVYGHAQGIDAVSAGNLLADPAVPHSMITAFEAADDETLEQRLLHAFHAGIAAGGEAGPIHSAVLLVAGEVAWPVTDLRVDWSEDPLSDLRALWELWKPQQADYVTRALEPHLSPSYGVPGDD